MTTTTVIITPRSGFRGRDTCQASIVGTKSWAPGKTIDEALGDLVKSNVETFPAAKSNIANWDKASCETVGRFVRERQSELGLSIVVR